MPPDPKEGACALCQFCCSKNVSQQKFLYETLGSHIRSCPHGLSLTTYNTSCIILHSIRWLLNYTSEITGYVSIPDGVTFTVDSDMNGDSPQFTLTCISTGGPATTVTWTRDSEEALGERVSVLTDPVTAQYTHTLTVNGRLEGQYKCTVSNNKPSTAAAVYTVIGKKGLLYLDSSIIIMSSLFLEQP